MKIKQVKLVIVGAWHHKLNTFVCLGFGDIFESYMIDMQNGQSFCMYACTHKWYMCFLSSHHALFYFYFISSPRPGGGDSVQKTLRGHAANTAESASWYMNDPFQNDKFGIWMGRFFKIFQKFWKNQVILLKIWSKIGPIGVWIGLFFLEKLVFVWVYFHIWWRHVQTKTKLEYPRLPGFIACNLWVELLLQRMGALLLPVE